jgi:Holliday junction resolvase
MSSLGINRERQVRRLLEDQDYWVCRAAGSLGDADLVALKTGKPPLLIEVKTDKRGPFAHFGPKRRGEFRLAAEISGAIPVLYWWPSRGELHTFNEGDWPA